MANLSLTDRTLIAEHLLGHSLDHLRDSLEQAERTYKSGLINDHDTGDNDD